MNLRKQAPASRIETFLCVFQLFAKQKGLQVQKMLNHRPFLEGAYGHSLFISTRCAYFPWDHINCIKEDLSNDGKDLAFAETSFH